ncbi:MAG: nuclear transport factor 2 family protein [Dehalococcoidia bacterium]
MARFSRAYFRKDREMLAEAITPDAEWHFAFGPDVPNGRVRAGIDGFMQGIAENDELFERLRFEDVVIRGFSANEIIMTYLAAGTRRNGESFQLRGIELIRVKDGRVALKDVYWKQEA